MVGMPKYLNTKEDYEYVRLNFAAELWKPKFQALLDERFNWFNDGALVEGAAGVTDDTHKIVENKGPDDAITRYQYVLMEDENCAMFRVGYTVNEITEILANA